MSRLIVKNLPKKITPDKLRETFSVVGGQVTDVQLKFTKDGVFRHFGFVGFRDEREAEVARKHLDGAFIGACKVSVETCADLGSADKPRAWSKYSVDSSGFKAANGEARKEEEEEEEEEDLKKKNKKGKKEKSKQKKVDALLEKYKDDPKFQEFLRVHKRNASGGVWNNDAILQMGQSFKAEEVEEDSEEDVAGDREEDDDDEVEDEEEEEEEPKVAKDAAVSDLDYIKAKTVSKSADDSGAAEPEVKKKTEDKKKQPKDVDYFTVKVSGLPYKVKKKDLKSFFKPLPTKSIRIPLKIKGIAYIGFASEKEGKKALNMNKTFLSGHQIFIKPYLNARKRPNDAAAEEGTTTQQQEQEKKWKEQEEGMKNEETVAESGRIFVRNLSYTVTESDLEILFKTYGPLTEVSVPIDRQTRKVKGFAFVTFMVPENAVKAFEELDGTTFQGRLIHLIPGKSKLSPEEVAEATGVLSFKQKKTLKEKSQSGSSHNWNTMFLGASAVADLMADKYGVSKSDVLTGAGGKQSAAVRLALGETQIVAETRQFLQEQGVSVDAFSDPTAKTSRSSSVILVKNLPSRTPAEEIRDLFAKHGELGRVVLPPHGVTAVVEFYESAEAKKAFRALAYTTFRNTPLYLEWAPENCLTPVDPAQQKQQPKPATSDSASSSSSQPAEANATLFVKNLNFLTSDEALTRFFSQGGVEVHSASISKKKDVKNPGGEMLSMGYGFVQFKTSADADKALKNMQHKMLDQHCLELKRSTRASTAKEEEERRKLSSRKTTATSPDEIGTKILVRNIPFEATAKEVEEIFKTFGTLKWVRLPKKITGSHRGFAFVEFASKEEAKKAFGALCHSTHLYGRRLVLEWAEEEETIEGLRKKTASHFAEGGGGPAGAQSKRVKKSEFVESVVLKGSKS